MTEIHGECRDDFEPVRKVMADHFEQGLEQGASVCVTLRGEPVVDLWAGDADGAGRPWERDTIVNVYSTTKTMAATCMLMLADRGEIDFAAPVAEYWPEFAANGKEGVLVSHVTSHQAGLSGYDPAITATDLYDEVEVEHHLARQAPWWEPGTGSGYHAISQGNLEAGIVRRVTGRSIGTFFREEVAEPLGADFHIGLPASEDARVADLVPPPVGIEGADVDETSIAGRTLLSCPLDATEPRTRAWRGAEIPAAGGTGNARSVGRVHSALACGGEVDGVRLLSAEGVERVLEPQCEGVDKVLGMAFKMGMGFGLMNEAIPLSPNPRAFFWGGWGGSIAIVDLDAQMTVSYVMNRMAGALVGDLRGALITFAAYASLAG
jgi:CubicO group peptidase (beta-lactamase class C family)